MISNFTFNIDAVYNKGAEMTEQDMDQMGAAIRAWQQGAQLGLQGGSIPIYTISPESDHYIQGFHIARKLFRKKLAQLCESYKQEHNNE